MNIVLLHSVLTRLVKVRKSKQSEMASTFKDFVIKTILHKIWHKETCDNNSSDNSNSMSNSNSNNKDNKDNNSNTATVNSE